MPASEAGRRKFYPWAVAALAGLLGALAIHAHWKPNQWVLSDGIYYLNVARGWLEKGSLRQEGLYPASWVEQSLGWNDEQEVAASGVALGRHGEWWPKHPVLMPVTASPLIWALGVYGALLFQWLTVCALAWFSYRVAARVASPEAALLASVAVVATPFFFGQAWGFNNDAFSALFVLAALDAALAGHAFAAGLLAGTAVAAKPSGLLYLPAVLGYLAWSRGRASLMHGTGGAALPLAAFGALNAYMFGAPWVTAYQRVLLRAHGAVATLSASSEWLGREALPRLGAVLGGDQYALLRAPVLLFGLAAGLVLLMRREGRREAALLAWCLVVPTVLFAPEKYFRLDYLLAQVCLSGAAVAAAAELVLGGNWSATRQDSHPEGERPVRSWPWKRWSKVAGVAVVLVLVVGIARRVATGSSGNLLWDRVLQARVFLGDQPCDFFNYGFERWECRGPDRDPAWTSGRWIERPSFGGSRDPMVLLSPHPIGERRWELEGLSGRRLVARFGFPDGTGPGASAAFRVSAGDAVLVDMTVSGPGLHQVAFQVPPGEARLRLAVAPGPPAGFGVSLGYGQ